MKAAIVGIAGPELGGVEAGLLRAQPPAGVILFARNIIDPPQLAALVAALRRVLPADAVLMVDQEGGRVARLRPPHWRAHPPAAALGALFARSPAGGLRAAWLTGALIGLDCAAAGLDVVAAPVLDLRLPGAHAVIGDRALAADPVTVGRLGRAVAAGLLAAGVQPVGKHAPGHGRARLDSHLALPEVAADDLDADLLPFALNADLPWAMTAHILYPTWDPARGAARGPGRTQAGQPGDHRAGHPWADRLRGSAGDRRPGDARTVRRAGRSGAAGAGGRLRPGAVLRRRGGADGGVAGGLPGGDAGRGGAAWAGARIGAAAAAEPGRRRAGGRARAAAAAGRRRWGRRRWGRRPQGRRPQGRRRCGRTGVTASRYRL
jgi:hypothetical protein